MVLSFRLPKPNPDELSRSQRSEDPAHGGAAQRKFRNAFGMQQTIFESENSDAGAGVGGGISFFDLPVRI